jgi:hypothetical protein
MRALSEYRFPVVAAADDVMMVVIILSVMVTTTVMEEQHDNNYYFEAATMLLLIRECQLLGSASCRSLFNGGLRLRPAAFLISFSLSLFPLKRELLLSPLLLIASVQNNYAGHQLH